jgi:hypothetical protein
MPNTHYEFPLDHETRVRADFETERGDLTRFVVRLEQSIDGEWRTVAHFDHNPRALGGHDVTEEGLHMDRYHPDGTVETDWSFGRMAADDALAYCTSYFIERYDSLKWPTGGEHDDD